MEIWTLHGTPAERYLTIKQVLNKCGYGPYPIRGFLRMVEYEQELFERAN